VPRIRSIKPEFWDSPSTASASVRVRLLFIAMWNWADDHGVLIRPTCRPYLPTAKAGGFSGGSR
jgi:hypothetical protein